ncbi:HPF/RaiA family ribosome-associated protein [Flavobacterium sp. DG1-102-2]|uniref:HPF/RaiA family ribosome-associated protein n=1 Tax=Flavobacterium sp. DG1-102-2 TaxID=3081663 RepID=UPI002949B432|nr:HPF/RaiA family ribosome-associated protein [Flavobacterium sp. DG1-102-2]MDV6169456.1 HPF/RaiA family ribosome-associated protein [Flavobacterium sp. DG1-102-2]
MQIQFSIDCADAGHERIENYFTTVINETLKRFDDKITGINVHLADENGDKPGPDDKRCTIEAHAQGLKAVAVTNHADTVEKAIKGAADKMKNALDHAYGKLQKSH